ncbi:MAG: hypothetical protein KDD62_01300 [Bdellovibrionales bacterium]|nr:hypothetical protein [Bdellovibrionales bacterium]
MKGLSANCSDFPAINICFQDPEISFLFAELLEARGAETRLIFDTDHLPETGKIVTEPIYFHLLPERMTAKNCLLVGNPGCFSSQSAICLSRPLTADKIETAITELLD